MTHTYSILGVSHRTFREIYNHLLELGEKQRFHEAGEEAIVIDMHGVALQEILRTEVTVKRVDHVISWVEAHKHAPFALSKLQSEVPGRRATLYSIMGRLRSLGFVGRTDKYFATKLWWATDQWRATTVQQVKERYEAYMLVKQTSRGELR